MPACAVELQGRIISAGSPLPADIQMLADRADKLPSIVGTITDGRYRIDLPDSGMFRLRVQAADADAAPHIVRDPLHAPEYVFLLHPAKLPQAALAAELISMGERDQAVRAQAAPLSDRAYW